MLGSEAVTLMKRRLQRSTAASSELDDWILDELRQAQQRLEREPEAPWFLLSERSFIDITQGEERVVLPTDFLREHEEDDMQVLDTSDNSYNELRKSTMQDMRPRYPDEEEGRPYWYSYNGGDYFRLRPIPDKSTYRLYMTYYQNDDDIELAQENRWLKYYPDLIISEGGIVMALGLRNEAALQGFQMMSAMQKDQLARDNIARKMANYDPNPED